MKIRLRLPQADRAQLIREYDDAYLSSGTAPDEALSMSRSKLYEHYGVRDGEKSRDSERISIAWRILHSEKKQAKAILDYGCGSAKAAVVLSQEGAEVFGFDISSASIQLGIRRAKVNNVENCVHLLVASGDKLPFKTASFDYVFGYEVLYYLNGKLPFGDEILRVLKPGGKAIFCEALAGNPFLGAVRAALRLATRTINRTGGAALTKGEIEAAFRQSTTIETYPVNILGMAKRVLHGQGYLSTNVLGFLRWVDGWLMKFPVFRRLCGEVVIVVTK